MPKWIKFIIALAFAAFIASTSQFAHAKSDEIYTSWRNNMAISGYDAVSFHRGNPVEGRPKLSALWRGAQWQFINQRNLDAFLENPEQYAPAYGGYCAWAMAKNKLAKGKTKHWEIKDGVLYLNFNKKIKDRWLKDPDGFIIEANKNWPEILDK